MGLSNLRWGLVVLVSRENLAEMTSFKVRFDPALYAALRSRARLWHEAMTQQERPCGEPDRGHCHTCPYARDCPEYGSRREAATRGDLPDLVRLELECLTEELAGLEHELDPLQERTHELRERLRETLQKHEASLVELEAATVQLIPSSRTSLEARGLQREAPELYQRFLKTSTFSTLRITYRGQIA